MRYAKGWAAVVFAVLVALAAALTDGLITQAEWLQIAIEATTAVSVVIVPNATSLPWAKTAVAGVLVGLNFATTVITGGLTGAEIVNIAVAVLGVYVVYRVPNGGPVVLPGSQLRRE